MSGINLSPEEKDIGRIVAAIAQLMQGRNNAVGVFTLEPGATETVVEAPNFGIDSYAFLLPLTATASAAWPTTWFDPAARAQGQFTIRHANAVSVDRDFAFVGLG